MPILAPKERSVYESPSVEICSFDGNIFTSMQDPFCDDGYKRIIFQE